MKLAVISFEELIWILVNQNDVLVPISIGL